MHVLLCIVNLVVWCGLLVLGGLLLQWAVRRIFAEEIPPRIIQVATFLVLFIAVVEFFLCLLGKGPYLPLLWGPMVR